MGKQLDFFEAEPTPPTREEAADWQWHRGLPNREGLAAYVHLERAPDDPERDPRGQRLDENGRPLPTTAWRELSKVPATEWADRFVAHLTDGIPRTFNRMALELTGFTADVLFGADTPDDGLWLAVEQGRVLWTAEAPVRFTAAECVKGPRDSGQPPDSVEKIDEPH